jgi:hypothetical protein
MTATATLTFDQLSYGPVDPIHFQVVVSVPMSVTTTVTGSVELPDGTELPAESTTTVHGTYGPFVAAGYDVEQDPDDPSRFTLTPAA